jgi:hypothetical protein
MKPDLNDEEQSLMLETGAALLALVPSPSLHEFTPQGRQRPAKAVYTPGATLTTLSLHAEPLHRRMFSAGSHLQLAQRIRESLKGQGLLRGEKVA